MKDENTKRLIHSLKNQEIPTFQVEGESIDIKKCPFLILPFLIILLSSPFFIVGALISYCGVQFYNFLYKLFFREAKV